MQSCMICGPDVDCLGHPQKKRREKEPIDLHVPAGKCPICFRLGKKKPKDGKHILGGAREVERALVFGPVWCHVSINNKAPGEEYGRLKIDDDFTVHGTRRSSGTLELNTAAGWVTSFTAIWAKCSPAPYAGKA